MAEYTVIRTSLDTIISLLTRTRYIWTKMKSKYMALEVLT